MEAWKFISSIDVCVTSDTDMYIYLPSLVLKPRHLSGSGFCRSEQALGGIPLGFGIVVENKLSYRNVCIEVTCTYERE